MASFSSKFLKKRFAKAKDLRAVADRKSPGMRLFNHVTQGGSSIGEPVIFDGPQGFSYSLTAAQAVAAQSDRGASLYDEFVSTFGQYHGEAVISAQAVAGSKTNEDAYLRQLTEVMLSSLGKFGSIAARRAFGPVGGSIGRITDVTAGADGEMTLSVRGDCFNVQPGMILQAADGTGNGIPSNVRSALGYVISVDPNSTTKQIAVATSEANRVAGTVGKPSDWANNDYIFRNGDISAAADLSDIAIRSLQGWITLTAATGDYNGVNRSQDARYSGNRLSSGDVSSLGVLDRCFLLVNECQQASGAEDVDYLLVGPRTWQQAADEARSYGTLQFGTDTKIGVTALTLMCSTGPVKLIADPHVLEADIWAVTSSNMMIYSYDGFPALDDGDGNEILRQTSAAAYAVRYHAFNNLTVNGKPWTFGRCSSGN